MFADRFLEYAVYVVTLICFLALCLFLAKDVVFALDHKKVMGTEIDYVPASSSSGGLHPVVQFSVDGKSYQFTGSAEYGTAPEKGSQVPVFYDAMDPQDAKMTDTSTSWMDVIVSGGLTLVFGATGMMMFNDRKKREARGEPVNPPTSFS